MNFVEELRWRGMIYNIIPGTEEQLAKEMTTAYVGIDPTADSLHIGHLVSVMMMKHLSLIHIFLPDCREDTSLCFISSCPMTSLKNTVLILDFKF